MHHEANRVVFSFTNLAVILILSIVLNVLWVDRILDVQGIGLDIANLLVFAAVFGFGGSFISLAMSKWTNDNSQLLQFDIREG